MKKTKKRTILLVEDDRPLLENLSKKLKKEGFRVYKAQNGKKGLRLALKRKPDFLLIDLLLPRMGGIELMEQLREDGKYGMSVPVIILTHVPPENEDLMKAIVELKPSYYLLKDDFTMNSFMAKINEMLNIDQ